MIYSHEGLGSWGFSSVYQVTVHMALFPSSYPLFNALCLAHLSQRPWSWSGVRRHPSVVIHRHLQCSNIFFSETAWLIKAKFYVEPPWVGGMKFCSRHLDHMTKMATMPIYGKKPSKIFFSRAGGPICTKLGM